jgi:Domain of unknown function (DUF4350)
MRSLVRPQGAPVTASSASPRGAGSLVGWALAGAGALVTVLVVVAIGGGGREGAALSPTSDARLGTSAMVALAGELGADVNVSDRLPNLGDDDAPAVVVLFVDLLDDDQRDALEDWVTGGGVLVVTDPVSTFAPPRDGEFARIDDLAPPRRLSAACDIDALAGVDVGGVEPRNGGVLYEPGAGASSCVDNGSGDAYIVATDRGDGTVVAVGGAGMMVNAALAEGENAPAVSALVAPEDGTRLLVLEPGPLAGSSTGRRSLRELIPAGVWRAMLQLGVAFVVYAVWRSRRLGRPVPEPAPSPIAGSELVAAVGTLLDRSGSPGHAAELLRRDLRRFLGEHLGVPRDTPADVLAAVAAERTGVDQAALQTALGGPPVTDDQELAALAATIDRIREEVLAHV